MIKSKRTAAHEKHSQDDERPRNSSSKRGQEKSSQSQSQSQSQEPLTENDLNRLGGICANFFLVANYKKIPIKRADVGKLIPKEFSRSSSRIIKAATEKLQEVFGYRIVELDKKGCFILKNSLDLSSIFEEYPLPIHPHESSVLVLRTNILIVILMSGGVINEGPLLEFLRKFEINLESREQHPLLGNVQKLVYQDFVRQGYLEIDQHKDIDPPIKEFRWGNRAKEEVNQKKLIKYVCEIYGENCKPEMWVEQWKTACATRGTGSTSSDAN